MRDLVLPAFELDCRDWFVSTPAAVGLPDEVAGAPLLAVLSTVVVAAGDLCELSGVLTMGLLDGEIPPLRPVAAGSVAGELIDLGDAGEFVDGEEPSHSCQYVLPAPGGRLALLAEFRLPPSADAELAGRVEALMASFRWAI